MSHDDHNTDSYFSYVKKHEVGTSDISHTCHLQEEELYSEDKDSQGGLLIILKHNV